MICRTNLIRVAAGAAAALSLQLALGVSEARAAVIDVVPSDSADTNIAKIEGAVAGDEVVVHPGTYQFRLYLEGQGTADQPIVIRAADPCDRPVWDLSGDLTANWPGSYGGGDAGRGIWQVTGTYYQISGIVFRHGTDGQANGSGLRFKSSANVSLSNCLFQQNDNGIQGSGTSTLVEHCEFDRNGDPSLSEGSHNLYVHGGTITVRYCYIHDATASQNLHIRATDSVFEYNWVARSQTYMGDMMTCSQEPCSTAHHMLLRGNVFVRGTPQNDGQVFALYNDQGTAGVSFDLTMIDNTIIGNGDGAALVHLVNDTGDIQAESATIHNNAVYDVARVFWVQDPGIANTATGGSNNWLSTGTADTSGLGATVTGSDPGFADPGNAGYVPAAGSALIGAGNTALSDRPTEEYYRDEQLALLGRDRATAHDIGAFESNTESAAFGPALACGGAGGTGAGGTGAGGTGQGGSAGHGTGGSASAGAPGASAGDAEDSGGCGCRMAPASGSGSAAAWLLCLAARRRWLGRPLRGARSARARAHG